MRKYAWCIELPKLKNILSHNSIINYFTFKLMTLVFHKALYYQTKHFKDKIKRTESVCIQTRGTRNINFRLDCRGELIISLFKVFCVLWREEILVKNRCYSVINENKRTMLTNFSKAIFITRNYQPPIQIECVHHQKINGQHVTRRSIPYDRRYNFKQNNVKIWLLYVVLGKDFISLLC